MRLIAAWTDPLTTVTLTGNRVGVVTLGGTLRVLPATTFVGAVLGVFYASVRRWFPSSHRTLSYGVLALLLPGGLFLSDEEFELFEPPLLTALLFLPVFPLGGLALAALVERLQPSAERPWEQRDAIVFGALIVLGAAVTLLNLMRLA